MYLLRNDEYFNFIKKVNNIIFCENMFTHTLFIKNMYSLLPNIATMIQTQSIIKKKNTYWEFYRINSILGCGIRMIISAIYSGAKNIYIAGIDGYDFDGTNNHSFEENKPPGAVKGAITKNNSEILYSQMEIHFFWFYKYILELQKEFNFNIINLAEDYSEISQFGRITKEHKK